MPLAIRRKRHPNGDACRAPHQTTRQINRHGHDHQTRQSQSDFNGSR
jgi:hypothetical protein